MMLMAITLKKAKNVKTAPLVATGLIGGWLTARETGIRPLGGVILGAAGELGAVRIGREGAGGDLRVEDAKLMLQQPSFLSRFTQRGRLRSLMRITSPTRNTPR